MKKLLLVPLLSAGLYSDAIDMKLANYLEKAFSRNPYISDLKIKPIEHKNIPNSQGWRGVKLEISGKYRGKEFKEKQIFFTDGHNFSEEMRSLEGKDWKEIFTPKVDSRYYRKENLLYGSPSAKHKIVVFSDPLCPFCQQAVPPMLEYVKKYPKTFAVYYYHLPLRRIHPASFQVTRLMAVAQHNGEVDAIAKAYQIKISAKERDDKKIVEEFNKATGLNYKVRDIYSEVARKHLEADEAAANELEVRGTPTIYMDGKKTAGRFYRKVKIVD